MGKKYGPIYVDSEHLVAINLTENNGTITKTVSLNNGLTGVQGLNNYLYNIRKCLKIVPNGDKLGVFLGSFKLGQIDGFSEFARVDTITKSIEQLSLLSATEVRFLSQGHLDENALNEIGIPFKRPPKTDENGNAIELPTPKTDLHTHMSGAFKVDDLRELGEIGELNVFVPVWLLEKAGVNLAPYSEELETKVTGIKDGKEKTCTGIRWKNLKPEDKKLYERQLSIDRNYQETFDRMEECYDFRDPFVKFKEPFFDTYGKTPTQVAQMYAYLLKEQLERLYSHYEKTSVEYVEFSVSELCKDGDNERFLAALGEVMPQLEEKHPNVKIRFLGGIPRVLTQSAIRDRTAFLLKNATNKYVAGMDIMAHELNNTNHFSCAITECLDYAVQNKNPAFVIRVHAGESDIHNDNVKNFLKIVTDYKKENNLDNSQLPFVRIGHGIHGLDAETIQMLKDLGDKAIIEMNPSSNFALDNVDDLKELPIQEYFRQGLHIVLGTDGHGMYSTDSRQEAMLAYAMGITLEQLREMQNFEKGYIEAQSHAEEEKKYPERAEREEEDFYKYKHSEHLTDQADVKAEKTKLQQAHLQNLQAGIQHATDHNINLVLYDKYYKEPENETEEQASERERKNQEIAENKEKMDNDIKGKKPICILGHSNKSWNTLSEEEKEAVLTQAIYAIRSLNPEKEYLITPGLDLGFNGYFLKMVKELKPSLTVVSYLSETKLGSKYITQNAQHVRVLKGISSFSMSSQLASDVGENKGKFIVFGEGATTNDYVNAAHKGDCNIKLYNGEGGCKTKAKLMQGNKYEFKYAKKPLTAQEKQILEYIMSIQKTSEVHFKDEHDIDVNSDLN